MRDAAIISMSRLLAKEPQGLYWRYKWTDMHGAYLGGA